MDIPADFQAIIRETARQSAKEVVAEQKRNAAGRCDRRLRNTKLLLKNYRAFKKHCTGAVYTDETGEHDGKKEETALELLDMMLQRDNVAVVEAIRTSCRRTKIIIRHIDAMLDLYKIYCEKSTDMSKNRGLTSSMGCTFVTRRKRLQSLRLRKTCLNVRFTDTMILPLKHYLH